MRKINKLMALTVVIVGGTLFSSCSSMKQERILQDISLNKSNPSNKVLIYKYTQDMDEINRDSVPLFMLSVKLRRAENAPTLIQYYPFYDPPGFLDRHYYPDLINTGKPITIIVRSEEDLKIWQDWLNRHKYEQKVLPKN